ncbi:MAG: tRNA pseudouridine(38-40) synthase TruA [Pseudomonadota bacterium]
MPRYKLTLEYDGQPFAGWQRQADQPSVQQTLEDAVVALTGEASPVQGAGRTDAGVHAIGQVAHVDLTRDWEPFRLMEALNHHLRPAPVAVTGTERVADDWHARFSAIERLYVYRIVNRRAPLTFDTGKAWRVRQPLDAKAMGEAAKHLEGLHDFTTFRASLCQAKSPVKTVDMVAVDQDGPAIAVYVRARSFLHNQVRSFVGTLAEVGSGKWAPDDVRRALEAKDRAACGPVAPPDGLYLASVKYPD